MATSHPIAALERILAIAIVVAVLAPTALAAVDSGGALLHAGHGHLSAAVVLEHPGRHDGRATQAVGVADSSPGSSDGRTVDTHTSEHEPSVAAEMLHGAGQHTPMGGSAVADVHADAVTTAESRSSQPAVPSAAAGHVPTPPPRV